MLISDICTPRQGVWKVGSFLAWYTFGSDSPLLNMFNEKANKRTKCQYSASKISHMQNKLTLLCIFFRSNQVQHLIRKTPERLPNKSQVFGLVDVSQYATLSVICKDAVPAHPGSIGTQFSFDIASMQSNSLKCSTWKPIWQPCSYTPELCVHSSSLFVDTKLNFRSLTPAYCNTVELLVRFLKIRKLRNFWTCIEPKI